MKLNRRQKGIFGIIFIVALIILSWIGLSKLYPESNTFRYLPDRIYRIIKIVFGSDPSATSLEDANIPWELIVAKIFTIFILLFGAFKIIQKIFSEQYTLLMASFKQNHLISIGISKKGRQLLQSLREDKNQQGIAIEKETEHANISAVKKQGHKVIIGNAEDENTLLEAGIKRASDLIVFLDNEQTVIEVVESVQQIYKKSNCDNALRCYVHLRNPRLIDLVKNADLQFANNSIDLHFFNIHKMVARQFFTKLVQDLEAGNSKDLEKIVFIGFGDFAKAILLQALRIMHLHPNKEPIIAIYTEGANRAQTQFQERYPMAHKIGKISFHEFEGSFTAILDEQNLVELNKRAIVINAFDHDEINLNNALELLQKSRQSDFAIYTLNAEGRGLRALMEGSNENQRIHFFGGIEESCSIEFITGEKQDKIAQAIHDDYQKLTSGEASESSRYTSDWHTLSEDAKDANRTQADHIPFKLLLTGKPLNSSNPKDLQFTPEQVEYLAIIEHKRWMAHRYLHGWDFGTTRSDDLKLHPSLVPWEQISEAEKQKDRDTILRIHKLII